MTQKCLEYTFSTAVLHGFHCRVPLDGLHIVISHMWLRVMATPHATYVGPEEISRIVHNAPANHCSIDPPPTWLVKRLLPLLADTLAKI